MTINELRAKNPDLDIQCVCAPTFAQYGRVMPASAGLTALTSFLKDNTSINPGCAYVGSYADVEALPEFADVAYELFGGIPAQLGYCNGTVHGLEALEYHRNSEFLLAATDLALILGDQSDLQNNYLHTAMLEVFYVPAGTVVEMFGTTLHYAPSAVSSKGFCAGIFLPRGTNEDLPAGKATADFRAVNKWLLAHCDNKELVDSGVCAGLYGPGIEIVNA